MITVLHNVLQAIFNASSEPIKNVQHNNAQHAVLFEVIGLAIHLDTNSPLVGTAAVLLALTTLTLGMICRLNFGKGL